MLAYELAHLLRKDILDHSLPDLFRLRYGDTGWVEDLRCLATDAERVHDSAEAHDVVLDKALKAVLVKWTAAGEEDLWRGKEVHRIRCIAGEQILQAVLRPAYVEYRYPAFPAPLPYLLR